MQKTSTAWNQTRGDKDAFDAFKRMKDKEGRDEGLAEFMTLVAMKFGKETSTTIE